MEIEKKARESNIELLNNVGAYNSKFMPIHAIVCVCAVFCVCTLIDLLRINFVEKPFFKWFDAHIQLKNKVD